jgi:hypothetical protein
VLLVENNDRGFEAGATTAVIGLKTLRDHVALLNSLVYLEAAPEREAKCRCACRGLLSC